MVWMEIKGWEQTLTCRLGVRIVHQVTMDSYHQGLHAVLQHLTNFFYCWLSIKVTQALVQVLGSRPPRAA